MPSIEGPSELDYILLEVHFNEQNVNDKAMSIIITLKLNNAELSSKEFTINFDSKLTIRDNINRIKGLRCMQVNIRSIKTVYTTDIELKLKNYIAIKASLIYYNRLEGNRAKGTNIEN